MKSRRNFIKTGLAATVGIATVGTVLAQGESKATNKGIHLPGLIYTEKDLGMWNQKSESHLPRIAIDGNQITLTTDHGMSESHYIVRHTLVDKDGKVIGSKTFTPADESVSTYAIPQGYTGTFYATSFCNKHDFWVKEFEV